MIQLTLNFKVMKCLKFRITISQVSACFWLFLEPRQGVTIIIINSDVSLINDCVILL